MSTGLPHVPGPRPLAAGPPGRKPGALAGLRCLLGGIGFVATTPSIWPLAAVPVALALGLTLVLGSIGTGWLPTAIEGWIGPTTGVLAGLGVGLLKLVAVLAGWVVAGLVGSLLAQPLSGPALERIARRQELALGLPPRAPTGLLVEVARSLGSLLVGWAIVLPAAAMLLVLSFVVPAAGVVLLPLELLVAAIAMGWDLCDYPLSVRGVPIGRRVALLGRHPGAVLGLSLGIALIGMVPLLGLVFLPAGVAGATRLAAELGPADAPTPLHDGGN